jgi:hypothetical protein
MSKTFAEALAEDRRLVILRRLSEATGNHLNDSILKKALIYIGHNVGTAMVRADVTWLEQHLLVRIEKVSIGADELWIVHLTAAGQDVAEGLDHPGVAKPSPK